MQIRCQKTGLVILLTLAALQGMTPQAQSGVVVNVPVGVVVTGIPPGYQTVVVDGIAYYTINGVTYRQVANGYQVVTAPPAAVSGTAAAVSS